MDRRQLIVNCTTATFYQELATFHMKNRRNISGELHYKARRNNVRKTPGQDMDKVKAVELQIAVSMTCHCPVRTVDHLSEIMVAHGLGGIPEHIKLHRSKCAYLIRNISPALKTDLIDDFQSKKYAISTDESTDISTQKHLCMLIQFVIDRRKEIATGFISLIPVQEATGEKMFNLIDEEIKR